MPRTAKDNSRYQNLSTDRLLNELTKALQGGSHMLTTAIDEVENGTFDPSYVTALTRMVRANTLRADVIIRELGARA